MIHKKEKNLGKLSTYLRKEGYLGMTRPTYGPSKYEKLEVPVPPSILSELVNPKQDDYVEPLSVPNYKRILNQPTNKEEDNMSNTTRRVVTVTLMDDDKGLDVADSLVCKFKNIVTEDDNQTVIQEVIMEKDIAKALKEHNEKRVQTVDLDILSRTGNTVYLRPVKLKNLRWEVSQ
jgi:hypothetical protein